MAWVALVLGGMFEIVWACALKQSYGFTRVWPSVIAIGGIVLSLMLLSWSMRVLPLGTAYMVWTGIGAVGAFVVGIVAFGEAVNPVRLLAALLILAGLTLMKLAAV